mmetsp:Transcript_106853/g.300414  ORF Transcript_106853/g.300414 Transcript_106853/m.300414 type:complete len:386 (-) Transcript_106853:84-1241(-)
MTGVHQLLDSSSALVDFESIPVQQEAGCDKGATIAPVGASRRRERGVVAHRPAGGHDNFFSGSAARRSRSRRGPAAGTARSGAAIARNAVSSRQGFGTVLDDEEFDPSLSEASFSQHASSSSTRPTRRSGAPRGGRSQMLRHPSPRRALRESMAPESLPELYVEMVRRGRNSRSCLQCSHAFRVGQLQLGYTVDTLSRHQPSRWIHVECAADARLRIRAGSTRVAVSPEIPEAVRQDIVNMLRRLSASPGPHEVRKWNYLAAAVRRWGSQLIPEFQEEAFDIQPIAGVKMSQRRELEVSAMLASLPSYPLDSDMDEGSPCAVCQVAMRRGDMICRLPCHHAYHVGCIDAWLRVRTTCPLDNLCVADMLEKLSNDAAGNAVTVLSY